MMPLMNTFSRPEISGWKPAPSSMSADTRPSTRTVPDVGLVMPAMSLSAVLLPEPFRPMTPNVEPLGTLNVTSVSAGNVSLGCRSRRMLRCRSALLSVAKCLPLYRRYTFETLVSSMAFIVRSSPPRRTQGGEGFSYGLRKRIPEPIEQPVPRQKQQHGPGAERQQPLPMADRTEEQNLLIRDREVREGVEVEERLVALHAVLPPRIDDRRREEPQHQDVGEQIPDVAKVHGQRREHQRQAGGKHELDEH